MTSNTTKVQTLLKAQQGTWTTGWRKAREISMDHKPLQQRKIANFSFRQMEYKGYKYMVLKRDFGRSLKGTWYMNEILN